jgi:hypothetical protein
MNGLHPVPSDHNTKDPWHVEGDTLERNEKARKAYQALLTVTTRTPDNVEYLNFSREVKSLAQSRYNFTFGNTSVSTFVTAFYDAVLLYALALKESLPDKPGEVNLDGGNLTRRMWGRSFRGEWALFTFRRLFALPLSRQLFPCLRLISGLIIRSVCLTMHYSDESRSFYPRHKAISL